MDEREQVIDREIFDELREVMGEDLATLVTAFVNDGEKRIQTLRQAHASRDFDTFRDTAHSFKGSSSNLGAADLADLCARLQDTPVSEPQVPDMLKALEQEFVRACRDLERLVSAG